VTITVTFSQPPTLIATGELLMAMDNIWPGIKLVDPGGSLTFRFEWDEQAAEGES
jgi:hypothetical protein